jgi:hypothetical protein
MTCGHCKATIAAKALICCRCGNATTEARVKPPSEGSLFDTPRRRVPLWVWILVAVAVVAPIVFALVQDSVMASAAGEYVDRHRAALAGAGAVVAAVVGRRQ